MFLNIGDWQKVSKCELEFCNVLLFHIEADNVEFDGNELITEEVFSSNGEHFKGFFSEGHGKAGKIIEIKCEYIRCKFL